MSSAYTSTCSNDVVEFAVSALDTKDICSQLRSNNLLGACVDTSKDMYAGFVASRVLSILPNATITCTTPSSSSEGSSSSCFAGSEVVELISGEMRAMSEIKIGDTIAVATMDGQRAGFSPVVTIPHAKNKQEAEFVVLRTTTGRDIKMTADHLLMGGSCAKKMVLVQAGSLKMNDCILAVSGSEELVSVSRIVSRGIYTVVTQYDGLLIVNGIVSSPFATNHLAANSFYNIVRLVSNVLPSMMKTLFASKVIELFGDMITSVSA